MFAVEFQTTIKDGTIEIPPEYRHYFPHEVRVILLTADQPPQRAPAGHNLITQLLAQPLVIAGFTPLPRETLYER